MTRLARGRIYRARPVGFDSDTYFLVVSNNARNRQLTSVLAVRFTTSAKPMLPNIVEIPATESVPGGRVVCDDLYELFEDEVTADLGAISPATMRAVEAGLKAALGLG